MNNQIISNINQIFMDNISINKDDSTKNINFDIKDIQNIDQLNKNVNDIDKVDLNNTLMKYEAPISNTSFGFNFNTKDFYIKVQRGNVESQYPTDEMMKLKEYLLNLNKI